MTAQYLRVSSTVEGFQDRLIVVQLSERGVQLDQEHVVDTRMADIMSNRRYEESERFKRTQETCDRCLIVRERRWFGTGGIGREDAYLKEKVKD